MQFVNVEVLITLFRSQHNDGNIIIHRTVAMEELTVLCKASPHQTTNDNGEGGEGAAG